MKLIVQIPCYNEEHTLPETFNDIPREIEGVDTVEIMIIDDGSTDRTIEVAKSLGVDHIIRNKNNRGLARTFRKGIDECLKLGADIIVNTDGDNQYAGWDIPKLIKPILEEKADVVVGDRKTQDINHFSPLKKLLQRLGSYVVKKVSGVQVPDAVSGFRAYSREAALQLNIISPFSYTIEALIQSGKKHMAVTHVPVETNAKTRESRLFTSIPKFIERQLTTIVRMYTMYQPLRVFVLLGALITLIGLIPIVRFLIFYMMGDGNGHLQSLILGGVLTLLGIITFLIAILADLINFNRQLIEQTLEKVRRMELQMLDENKERESARNDTF
ncbi:glycosyltransferase family 2 protein [Alteromonas mediterranea]|uniref:Glycosyl transferase n=1 Tax=Alteromonas mediterranea (strain DSM 17117 / CIP 110805 / LMG 28347 / Deep ecotype) TaxID=1774373 RepID=F2G7J4_ALTMD|nr:glycosyltransferase family 2 protein [Alteromonas mediterranea]AEA97644.1 glycosyl transferase [Alteromonas mediterranea DE]CAH1207042.1 Undecaprenyl-phosphate 4-deoxy-4-formamido-L-arabinose transferase [Alteromonas mediterranea]